MQFVDNATISVFAGNGGHGSAAARKEKFIPYGGPAGGDGADGGDVFLRATNQVSTLESFLHQTRRKAQDGENGQQQKRHGKRGEDLIIDVPVGTVVRDNKTNQHIVSLFTHDQRYCVARGGKGGWGNTHFTSSTTQFPSFALHGEPGEKCRLDLQLQLVADVALVGMPNVGKSTLITSITKTRSKVGAYPFTTVVPHIGMYEPQDIHIKNKISLIDVPGLIADASRGVGMGYQFLQHVLRAKSLIFVADISADYLQQRGTVWYEYHTYLQNHLTKRYTYDTGATNTQHQTPIYTIQISTSIDNNLPCIQAHHINKTTQESTLIYKQYLLFALTKADVIAFDTELIDDVQKTACQHLTGMLGCTTPAGALFTISGQTRQGCDEMMRTVDTIIQVYSFTPPLDIRDNEKSSDTQYTIKDATAQCSDMLVREGYLESLQDSRVWEISYPDFAYWVYILPWGNDEAELWFWQYMVKQGHIKILQRHGVKRNDILWIRSPYDTAEDRYIRWE